MGNFLKTLNVTARHATYSNSCCNAATLPRPRRRDLLASADGARARAGRWPARCLAALRAKGVTAAEVRGFAGAMRALARKPALPPALDAIDIVGTGGDASGSLNLSTGAALLAAACGLPVIKHGNRSISSRSGSADLIEALGFKLPLDESRAAAMLRGDRIHFFVCAVFSSRDEGAGADPRALGVRTVFNLLGPLTNPRRRAFV